MGTWEIISVVITAVLYAISIFIAGLCVGTQMESNKWVQLTKKKND